ncbi:MAG: hypothetical protein R2873_15375 [Caldilineaceae bacterium]
MRTLRYLGLWSVVVVFVPLGWMKFVDPFRVYVHGHGGKPCRPRK